MKIKILVRNDGLVDINEYTFDLRREKCVSSLCSIMYSKGFEQGKLQERKEATKRANKIIIQ